MKADTFQVRFGSIARYQLGAFANIRQEGKTGTIELKAIDPDSDEPEDACDDPEIVKLMVGYFYHLDYLYENNAATTPAVIEVPDSPAPPPKKKARKTAPAKRTRASTSAPIEAMPPAGPKVHFIGHAKVFAMAVKYHIAALQNLATQKFKAEVAEHWDHEDLAHAIHVIYTSTAEDVTQLREVAVEALNAHRDQLLEKPGIATLLRSITGLACDLLMRGRGSSTKHDFSKKTDVQEDAVCYAKYQHGLHQSVYGEECKFCHVYFEVCSACDGDPAFRGYPNTVWKYPFCAMFTYS